MHVDGLCIIFGSLYLCIFCYVLHKSMLFHAEIKRSYILIYSLLYIYQLRFSPTLKMLGYSMYICMLIKTCWWRHSKMGKGLMDPDIKVILPPSFLSYSVTSPWPWFSLQTKREYAKSISTRGEKIYGFMPQTTHRTAHRVASRFCTKFTMLALLLTSATFILADRAHSWFSLWSRKCFAMV